MRWPIFYAVSALLAVGAGIGVALSPSVALAGLGIMTVLLVYVYRPRWFIYATLALAFVALPSFLPVTFVIGGVTLQAFEPFLLLSVIYLIQTSKRDSNKVGFLCLMAVFVVFAFVVGIAFDNPFRKIFYDSRPLIEAVAVSFVAARIFGTSAMAMCLRVLTWVLWISAVVTFAGGALGLAVGGRVEQASLSFDDGGGDATRLLTSATFPALAVLCAVVGLSVSGRISYRDTWKLSIPSLVIVAMSFSRNSILALAIAILFAVVTTRTVGALIRAAAQVCLVAVAAVALVLLGPTIAQLPGGDWVNTQVSSYSERVIDGLNSDVQAGDASVQFRNDEDTYLMAAIAESPLIGHGFGFAYKPPSGYTDFSQNYAPYYAHNFFLWLLVKSGILGALFFTVAVATPLLRALKLRGTSTLALSVSLAALLGISVVAPLPVGATTSILFGALLGLLTVSSRSTSAAESTPARPQQENHLASTSPFGRSAVSLGPS